MTCCLAQEIKGGRQNRPLLSHIEESTIQGTSGSHDSVNENVDDLYILGVRENERFSLYNKDRTNIYYELSDDNGTSDDKPVQIHDATDTPPTHSDESGKQGHTKLIPTLDFLIC